MEIYGIGITQEIFKSGISFRLQKWPKRLDLLLKKSFILIVWIIRDIFQISKNSNSAESFYHKDRIFGYGIGSISLSQLSCFLSLWLKIVWVVVIGHDDNRRE